MTEMQMWLNFVVIECCSCSVSFAVTKDFNDRRRQDHATFHCPWGHRNYYADKSKADIAEQKVLEIQAKLNAAEHARLVAERERDKAIKAKRKVERRISKGVCPCCNRTFEDLARHMQSKHKDYALPPGKDPKLITGAVQ